MPKEKNKKKNEPIFNQDFLDKIVDNGDDEIVNMCKTCHNVPICTNAHNLMTTYDNLSIGQITVQCPFYISHNEIQYLNKRNENGNSKSKSSGKED